jgi:hypothetical protein
MATSYTNIGAFGTQNIGAFNSITEPIYLGNSTSALTLSQVARLTSSPRRVASSLVISQSVVVIKKVSIGAENTLDIEQLIEYAMPNLRVVVQELTISQNIHKNVQSQKTAPNTLNLSQVVSVIHAHGRRLHQVIHIVNNNHLKARPAVSSQLLIFHQIINCIKGRTNNLFEHSLTFRQIVYGTLATDYVVLQAPFDAPQQIIILPDPQLDDTQSLMSDIIVYKSMNNTARTLVKRTRNQKLKYTFRLRRHISLALENFFDNYNAEWLQLRNWKGEIWKVKLTNNPLEFVQTQHWNEVNIEFEGVRLR